VYFVVNWNIFPRFDMLHKENLATLFTRKENSGGANPTIAFSGAKAVKKFLAL
jgi:hypothetical protein